MENSAMDKISCDFNDNLADFGTNEQNCHKNNKLVKCGIDGCNWFQELAELLQHFNDEHHEQVKNLSDPKMKLIIGANNPVLLVKEYDDDAVDNSLYWLRFYKHNDSRYVMMLYIGRSNVTRQKKPKVLEYMVCCVKNQNLIVKSKVIINSGSEEEDVMNDTLILNRGTNVSVLASDHLLLQVMRPLRIPEAVLKVMECIVCMTIMLNDIKQCVSGHSFCTRCASNLRFCPACRDGLASGKNFKLQDMGQLIGDILRKNKKKVRCKHVNQGCKFIDIEEYVEDHQEHECNYKTPGNSQITNAVVPYSGSDDQLPSWIEDNLPLIPLFNGRLSYTHDAPMSAIASVYRQPSSPIRLIALLQLAHLTNYLNIYSNSDEPRFLIFPSEEDRQPNSGNTPSTNNEQEIVSSTSEEDHQPTSGNKPSTNNEEQIVCSTSEEDHQPTSGNKPSTNNEEQIVCSTSEEDHQPTSGNTPSTNNEEDTVCSTSEEDRHPNSGNTPSTNNEEEIVCSTSDEEDHESTI